MATTRVHILAKELGVKSTAIVEKCQAEGLDVKNHMSTISAGLAATISEWFSEGEHATTVETTARVDLKKVRIKKRKKKKEPAETEKAEKITEAADETIAEAKPEEAAQKTDKIQTKITPPVIFTPPKPQKVVPAGPRLEKPKPAKLSGPKVIRVEKTEIVKKPRPKPKTERPKYNQPITESLLLPDKLITSKKAKEAKGKKATKEKTRGRRKDTDTQDVTKKPKSARKLRERDIAERRARLEAARGESLRLRPSRKIETHQQPSFGLHERPEKATVTEPVSVKDLSAALAVKTSNIIAKLMQQGVMATTNQTIPIDVAELVALEFGTELIVERKQLLEEQIKTEFENYERNNLTRTSAVVTMLGHVDHGKTSLLDWIRKAKVAQGEAGGITQHIGAYQVDWNGKKVTFLDTPGHEAFTAMRARGANMTDVVVLVIAADDGVMPQTVEAINHAKAANVPIIVALNKIDLPGIDENRIYGQLAEHELTPVEWGGDVEIVKTSAITGQGIDSLIEHIDLTAELLELKTDNTIPATGWVIEAKKTTTQGAVATVLVKEGVLKKGNTIFAGKGYGRIRTIKNSFGKDIKTAASSMPVEVSGLNDVPQAGDKFYCLKDINKCKEVAEQNKIRFREDSLAKRSQVTLENLFSQIEAGSIKELNIIIRADVQGSVDVLIKYLNELSTDEVKIRILHAAVGGITEGDIVLAEASGAIIIGFNVIADDQAAKTAEANGIDIRLYNIIYRITEDLKNAMSGLLEPEEQEKPLGKLTVREVFKVSGIGAIAGCYVNSGLINKNARLRFIRDNIVLRDNCTIESLKHFKEDVREVKSGFECGIKITNFDDIKEGDVFEAYEIIQVARQI